MLSYFWGRVYSCIRYSLSSCQCCVVIMYIFFLTISSYSSYGCTFVTIIFSTNGSSNTKFCSMFRSLLTCALVMGRCRYFKSVLFFRLDALARSVIATATWLAGWVAAWLAVTLRYCIKTAKPIGKLFRPSESSITLVF